jgi:hypothetical protein
VQYHASDLPRPDKRLVQHAQVLAGRDDQHLALLARALRLRRARVAFSQDPVQLVEEGGQDAPVQPVAGTTVAVLGRAPKLPM